MKNTGFYVLPLLAMVVPFAWSAMTVAPEVTLAPYPLPAQEQVASDWPRTAGLALGLHPALVERAMTQREWKAFEKKMQVMRPGERQRYQAEVRARVLKRAQG